MSISLAFPPQPVAAQSSPAGPSRNLLRPNAAPSPESNELLVTARALVRDRQYTLANRYLISWLTEGK